MDEADRARGGGGRSGEEGDGAGESAGGGEDVGVEDPEDVVRCESIGTNEIVDLGVHADVLVACAVQGQLLLHPLFQIHAPITSCAETWGYFSIKACTIGIAASSSAETEKMMSNLG